MGPIGIQEMIAVFVIALILFGPKKLPELGRILAKGLSEFRRAKSELKATFETHLNELERETRIATTPTASVPDPSSSTYSYPYDEYGAYGSQSAQEPAVALPAAPVAALEPPVSPAAEVREEQPVRIPVPDTVPRGSGAFNGEPHS